MWNNSLQILGQSAAVLFVVGLLFVTVWVLRRRGLGGLMAISGRRCSARRLRVVERLMLSSQNVLFLIDAGGREWLVGSSPSGLTITDTAHGQAALSGDETDAVLEELASPPAIKHAAQPIPIAGRYFGAALAGLLRTE